MSSTDLSNISAQTTIVKRRDYSLFVLILFRYVVVNIVAVRKRAKYIYIQGWGSGRGKGQHRNQTEMVKGRGLGEGNRWVIIHQFCVRVLHPCTHVIYTFFAWLSLRTEDRDRGLIQRRGDKAKVNFDCCCLFLLSPKSNVIALLLSQRRRCVGVPAPKSKSSNCSDGPNTWSMA